MGRNNGADSEHIGDTKYCVSTRNILTRKGGSLIFPFLFSSVRAQHLVFLILCLFIPQKPTLNFKAGTGYGVVFTAYIG